MFWITRAWLQTINWIEELIRSLHRWLSSTKFDCACNSAPFLLSFVELFLSSTHCKSPPLPPSSLSNHFFSALPVHYSVFNAFHEMLSGIAFHCRYSTSLHFLRYLTLFCRFTSSILVGDTSKRLFAFPNINMLSIKIGSRTSPSH